MRHLFQLARARPELVFSFHAKTFYLTKIARPRKAEVVLWQLYECFPVSSPNVYLLSFRWAIYLENLRHVIISSTLDSTPPCRKEVNHKWEKCLVSFGARNINTFLFCSQVEFYRLLFFQTNGSEIFKPQTCFSSLEISKPYVAIFGFNPVTFTEVTRKQGSSILNRRVRYF